MCRESRKERSLGKVVTALVDNIITPLIGILVGGLDFTGLSVKVGEATIGYGAFIQAVINFLLISFVIFCVIRSFNKLAKKKEEGKRLMTGCHTHIKM